MGIPAAPLSLLIATRVRVLPLVWAQLRGWRRRAQRIPDRELRTQALASLAAKQFHCEGGAIYGLLAQGQRRWAIEFIVAYQTISDYLDNLCDRSESLDPADFAALHAALTDALTPGQASARYYRCRGNPDDGGYLQALVATCQRVLGQMPHYAAIAPALHELATYYCDLQIHKHVRIEDRVPRLQTWFAHHQPQLPDLRWYEFSASAGSTLGIFCLVAYGLGNALPVDLVHPIKTSYFPWVQGLHILLDYLIDQEEDQLHGDLNFCSFYPNPDDLLDRFQHFVHRASQSVAHLPHPRFHQLINQALLGVYLSDRKAQDQQQVQAIARPLIRRSGQATTLFFRSRLLLSQGG
jgi:tetraprenyl-beta-curcumene synthase